MRAKIVGRVGALAGQKSSRIADELGRAYTTVQCTSDKDASRNEGKSLPQKWCPPKLSIRHKRAILRIIRINPKTTYQHLRRDVNLTVSNDTIY